MLSTITEAINFIANGNKPWIPIYQQNKPIRTYYHWWYINWDEIKKGSLSGVVLLGSNDGLDFACSSVGKHLRFINKDAAEYAAKTFRPLYMKYIFGIE